MEAKHGQTQCFACTIFSLQRQINDNAVRVTNFMSILLENAVYAAACVSVSSHFGRQENLSAVCFSCEFGSFWT